MNTDLKKYAAAQTAASGGGYGAADTVGGDAELDRLYASIMGRRAFSYNAAADPLYGAMRDSYVTNGRAAMRDTMAQAASLTGGYSSTYAQSVGQQTYDGYLRSLSEAMPELYALAYERYKDEGARMREQYDLARQRSSDAYEREQDAYDRAWDEDERSYRRDRDAKEDAEREDERNYRRDRDAREDAERERKSSEESSDKAYARLIKLISSTGYSPTDDELDEAGLTRAQADALIAQYRRENGLDKPQGGSGGGGGSGGSGGSVTVVRDEEGAPIGENLRRILSAGRRRGR